MEDNHNGIIYSLPPIGTARIGYNNILEENQEPNQYGEISLNQQSLVSIIKLRYYFKFKKILYV